MALAFNPFTEDGRVVVANFEFPESQKITGFRPSYSRQGTQQEGPEN